MRRRDWATWLFALLIAIALWYYVVAQRNVTRRFQVPVATTGVAVEVVARGVPIELATRGQPAPGYRVDRTEFAPKIATVTGVASRISILHALPTEPLDLTDVRKDVEARLPLAPPAGVAVISPETVYVIVHIRPESPPVRPAAIEED